ncbi:hypothetical protein [Moorena sp. SIO3H5]|uniref:hypothetical protein n=1 Tax=Moorena sp. SIO3H5 TaxID=2607834 RepID=UPI0025D8D748|nr:hypothetical protein [Moorena sp. SIO3H5]
MVNLILNTESVPNRESMSKKTVLYNCDKRYRRVYVYRPSVKVVEELDNSATFSGESVLAGFVLFA